MPIFDFICDCGKVKNNYLVFNEKVICKCGKEMKKLILIILVVIGSSCNEPAKKPFIIIHKDVWKSGQCKYVYQDANGNSFNFYEFNDSYNIGDTIK